MNSEFFQPGIKALWDFHELDDFNISTDDMKRFVYYLQSVISNRDDHFRVAMLVNKDVAYGLSRMFQMYCNVDMVETKVFNRIEEAENWLTM